MEKEMNAAEIIAKKSEDNRTREILDILRNCETVEEAEEKIRALLK